MSNQNLRFGDINDRQLSRRVRRRRLFERLESRHMLAADVLFVDSFEQSEWNGQWVEDSQNDWKRSTQRTSAGSYAAEVDGRATDATLTMARAIDLTGYDSAELTFDYYIESGFDSGEYLSMDVSSDGGAHWQSDVRRLSGNVDAENTWHSETVDLTPYASDNLLVRFRSLVSRSSEDAFVDNVEITAVPDNAPPVGLISHWTADGTSLDAEENNHATLVSGAAYTTGVIGQAFSLDGVDDRILVNDSSSLRLTKSMTIEAWVRVDSFPSSGHGLVLFRGDDRGGLDPYQITTTPAGSIQFGISSLTGGTSLNAPMPQGDFVYVAATLDDATGEMNLYLNGVPVAQRITTERPFGALDPGGNPGIGIGNHGGYPTTPHNFPFHGAIDELKIHDLALSDAEILANFNAVPSIAIDDVSAAEGDSGTTAFVFTVARSGDISQATSVDFVTTDGTATAGDDYVAHSGTLTFPAGDSSPQTIIVQVNGETGPEQNEHFLVNLTNATVGTISTAQGTGAIIDDDTVPIGLISHWTADNTSVDAEGNNDGTPVSGAAYEAGPFGQAFSFDGIDDRVEVDDSLSLQLTKSMTIEGWVRVDSFPATGHGVVLFRGDDRGGLDPYQLTTTPNGEIHFGINSLTSGASVAADMPLGEYVYVAGTLDDATGEMSLYLNGVRTALKITSERPFGALDPDSNPGIGIGNHGGFPTTPHNFPFHGAIDELRIHDVALSSADLLATFHAGKGDPEISIDDVSVVEGDSGLTFTDAFVSAGHGGLSSARGITLGIDGNLYVSSTDTDSILRYNAATGAFMDEFVASGSGGLDYPRDLEFYNGDLFVVSALTHSVLRFNGTSGAFISEFVTSGSGGLEAPRGLWFNSSNDLFLTSAGEDDAILRYNATTGLFIDEFISSGDHGLNNPTRVVIGPDTNIYVSSSNSSSNSVLRYDSSGNFIDSVVASGAGGLDGPTDIVFDDGLMYVASARGDSVLAYEQTTGDFVGVVVDSGSGGLDNPNSMLLDNDGKLYVSSRITHEVLRFDDVNASVSTVSLSWPSSEIITVDFATTDGSALGGSDYDSTTGTVTFAAGETSQTILVPILSDAVGDPNESFNLNLTDPINATISDPSGLVTIIEREIAIEDVTVTEGDLAPPMVFATAAIEGSNFNTLAFGTDGDLFAEVGGGTGYANSIFRFDGTTGDFESVFVPTATLNTTRDMIFRDGTLYVADLDADQIKRYDAATGIFLGTFVGDDPETPGIDESGGLVGPEGMTFGPDGNSDGLEDLYVAGWRSNNILRYDGISGQYIDTLVTGLTAPTGLEYHDGSLFVTNQTNEVLEFDMSGTLVRSIGSFADGLHNPLDVAIGPHDGNLYVTSGHTSKVIRYDLSTGAYIDDFATAADGLDYSRSLTFHEGALFVTSINNDDVLRFAIESEPEIVFTVSMTAPFMAAVEVDFATSDGSANAGSDYVATAGSITFAPGQTTRLIVIPAIDDIEFEGDETFNVTLSSGSGVSIVDDTGIATILNDDPTPPNLPPVADDNSYVIAEDAVLSVTAAGVLDGDTDPENDPLTAELVSDVSSGILTLNPDGSFTYAPNTDFNGPDSFTYTANDGTSDSNVATVNLTVAPTNDAPAIVSTPGTVGAEGTPYSYDVDASDRDAGDTLIYSLDTSPTGMTIDPNSGLITWAPVAGDAGDHNVMIRVDDAGLLFDTQSFTLSISEQNDAPSITSTAVTSATEDAEYSYDVGANDTNAGDILTFSLDAAPAGMTIDAALGVIAWTPTNAQVGSSPVSVRVQDPGGLSDTQSFNVIVSNTNDQPTINTAPITTATEDQLYSYDVDATDPDVGETLTYTLVTAPAAMTIDSASGLIEWTPTTADVGDHTVTVRVHDVATAEDTQSFTVTVEAVASGPNLAHGVVSASSSWQTVVLPSSYASMVVIATPNYDSGSAPAVARIQNASGNSFEIRVDSAGPTAVGAMNVHYVVMEEGVYDEPGYKLEAVKYNSTVTDENNSWAGESRSYQQAYSNPVVIGQVMTYNDSDWSVFWAAGGSRTSPPSSTALTVGKNVGEDPDNTRADETVGYIVIETSTSGTAEIEGLPYVAAVGGDSVKGVGDSPAYSYSYSAMPNSKTALASQAGMDGGNGGWAVLYGDNPITPSGSTLNLAIDEDQSGDTERKHTTEQVAFFIIDPPVPQRTSSHESLPPAAAELGQTRSGVDSHHLATPIDAVPLLISPSKLVSGEWSAESTARRTKFEFVDAALADDDEDWSATLFTDMLLDSITSRANHPMR